MIMVLIAAMMIPKSVFAEIKEDVEASRSLTPQNK